MTNYKVNRENTKKPENIEYLFNNCAKEFTHLLRILFFRCDGYPPCLYGLSLPDCGSSEPNENFYLPFGEILNEKIWAVSALAKKTPWHVEVSVKKVKVESEVYICN